MNMPVADKAVEQPRRIIEYGKIAIHNPSDAFILEAVQTYPSKKIRPFDFELLADGLDPLVISAELYVAECAERGIVPVEVSWRYDSGRGAFHPVGIGRHFAPKQWGFDAQSLATLLRPARNALLSCREDERYCRENENHSTGFALFRDQFLPMAMKQNYSPRSISFGEVSTREFMYVSVVGHSPRIAVDPATKIRSWIDDLCDRYDIQEG